MGVYKHAVATQTEGIRILLDDPLDIDIDYYILTSMMLESLSLNGMPFSLFISSVTPMIFLSLSYIGMQRMLRVMKPSSSTN